MSALRKVRALMHEYRVDRDGGEITRSACLIRGGVMAALVVYLAVGGWAFAVVTP